MSRWYGIPVDGDELPPGGRLGGDEDGVADVLLGGDHDDAASYGWR